MGKTHKIAFGAVLRRLRKERGLTQEKLAFESGLDRTYISLLELGANSPSLDSMVALAKALKTTLPELMYLLEKQIEGALDG